MTLVSDVSEVPIDILHTSDTSFMVRLKMIDGIEILVTSPNVDDIMLSSGGRIIDEKCIVKDVQKITNRRGVFSDNQNF